MNKKGLALMFMIFIVAIISILFIAFLISSKWKWILIGIGLFMGALYVIAKTKAPKVKIALTLILIILGALFIFGAGVLQTQLTGFTPVFCNDYEFTCCSEVVDYTQNFQITVSEALMCPSTATKCTVTFTSWETGIGGLEEAYIGSGNCQYKTIGGWTCNNLKKVTSSTEMQPNEYIFTKSGQTKANIQNKVYKEQLYFTGKSASTIGVQVSGADGCKFNPEGDTIYSETGSKQTVTGSYTVPARECILSYQRNNRWICGYLEEQCDSDDDCGGHTYGNQECMGRTLQTYGCVEFGSTVSERDRLPFESGWGSNNPQTSSNTFGKRCEITSAQQVQCCGDTDCGSSMFCDTSDFTCKTEVECTKDSDCGVSVICDWTTKELKTPKCSGGKCDYDTESVECCLDTNCPAGYYCTADKECAESVVEKKECPSECCIGLELYFDRPCPAGSFCIDGSCTSQGCTKDEDCPKGQVCKNGDCIDKEELECEWWQESYTTTKKDYGFLYWRAIIGTPKEYEESGCKLASWWYLIVGGGVILILGIILILIFKQKRRK